MAKEENKILLNITNLKITIIGIAFTFLLYAIPSILEWIKMPAIRNIFSTIITVIYLALGLWLLYVARKIKN